MKLCTLEKERLQVKDIWANKLTDIPADAILGNHHDPHNRPILRSVFYFLGGLLQFISGLNDIHYYITRSLATGISLLPPLVYFGSCLFFDLTKNGWADPGFWFASGFNIVHLAPAAKLALRLEWQWGSRRWNRWIPIGVRRRKPTHSERASARRDWEFGWRERLGVSNMWADPPSHNVQSIFLF